MSHNSAAMDGVELVRQARQRKGSHYPYRQRQLQAAAHGFRRGSKSSNDEPSDSPADLRRQCLGIPSPVSQVQRRGILGTAPARLPATLLD
jgi:hypothetical protein